MSHIDDQFMTDKQLAERLNVSVYTVRSWRFRKQGPRYVQMNRTIRYPVSGVEEFLTAKARAA